MSYLPSSILAWLNNDNDDFMYIEQQVAKFPFFHLEAKSWYLDCSKDFVSKVEEPLFNNLVDMAPMEPKTLEEEPEEVQPQPQLAKDNVAKLAKGKSKKTAIQAFQAQVTTCFAFKASAQPSAALATTGVGSSFVTPSAAPSLIPFAPPSVPFGSNANVPSVGNLTM